MGPHKSFAVRALSTGALSVLLCGQAAAHDLIASVYRMARDGSDLKRLSGPGAVTPVWSPGGEHILYVQHSEGQEEVTAFHLISPQGGSPGSVPLPDTLNFTGGVSWHPGGTKVAFAAGRNLGGLRHLQHDAQPWKSRACGI